MYLPLPYMLAAFYVVHLSCKWTLDWLDTKIKTCLCNTISFHLAVMAGLAPEGSQFDARQYDTKMNEL